MRNKTHKKVWIFDLDNTLHNASAKVFPVMNQAMTEYIMAHLALDQHAADRLRHHYWRVYGATLKGLVRHHGVDPHHFLAQTHAFDDLGALLAPVKNLKHLLNSIKQRKCVFTNGPYQYANEVLAFMGVLDCFDCVFSVESAQFYAKPNPRGFTMLLNKLKVSADQCVMVEDNLAALQTAKRLGMTTVLVSDRLNKPLYVNYRVDSVLALTHIQV